LAGGELFVCLFYGDNPLPPPPLGIGIDGLRPCSGNGAGVVVSYTDPLFICLLGHIPAKGVYHD